jgi:protein tyrosine/serine phosphatase
VISLWDNYQTLLEEKEKERHEVNEDAEESGENDEGEYERMRRLVEQ